MCRRESTLARPCFLDAREIQFVSFSSLSPMQLCLRSEQIIRLLLPTVPMVALVSCASESASRAELSPQRTELQTLREENARLARRIEQLESTPRGDLPISGSASAVSDPREIPSLTVVKLKPKSDPAPKIAVAIPVVEPAPDQVEEILESPSDAPSRNQDAGKASDAALEAEFAGAVTALKTGNVSGGIARLQRFAAENRGGGSGVREAARRLSSERSSAGWHAQTGRVPRAAEELSSGARPLFPGGEEIPGKHGSRRGHSAARFASTLGFGKDSLDARLDAVNLPDIRR